MTQGVVAWKKLILSAGILRERNKMRRVYLISSLLFTFYQPHISGAFVLQNAFSQKKLAFWVLKFITSVAFIFFSLTRLTN
jgi:hypothetical protein